MFEYEDPLLTGELVNRYKRFLADIILDDGTFITAHVPNTGSMLSTSEAGSRVAVSHHPEPYRTLHWTLELVESEGCWVGVNTSASNRMVEKALGARRIRPLAGYTNLRREVKYGERSRVDLLLERPEGVCYVEIKNVTYKSGKRALFPDAVTVRGTRHLRELMSMVAQGHRAVIFFLVNRGDCSSMGPAKEIDPVYAETLAEAARTGVEAMAYRISHTLEGWSVDKKIPVRI